MLFLSVQPVFVALATSSLLLFVVFGFVTCALAWREEEELIRFSFLTLLSSATTDENGIMWSFKCSHFSGNKQHVAERAEGVHG